MLKSMLSVVLALVMLLSAAAYHAEAEAVRYYHDIRESVTDCQVSLRYLREGNLRYLAGASVDRGSFAEAREILGEAQRPFAVIVTCSDSRVAPEIYFDQGLGDIFVIRNAGNFADETTLGSIEFAVGHLGAPLVVVVGHTACGAVAGAMVDGAVFTENLHAVINRIRPVVASEEDLAAATAANIRHAVARIQANPVVIEAAPKVIGAIYDIVTGEVSFFEEEVTE